MPDDGKWSRDGDKKDEDIDDLPEAEALLIPEVEAAAPLTPAGNPAAPRPKQFLNPGVSWTISVDEAVNYGFKSIKEVLPYLVAIILSYATAIGAFAFSLSFSLGSETENEPLQAVLLILSFLFLIAGILTQLSLMIGLGYKFGGDILLRAVRFHHLIEKKK